MCGVTKVVLKTGSSMQMLPTPVNNVCYRTFKKCGHADTTNCFVLWCGVTKVVLRIVDNMEMLPTPVNHVYYRIVNKL